MTSTLDTNNTYARAPWGYQYSPYTMSRSAQSERDATDTEIPAFEIFDAEGNKIFDTNEDSPAALQEANARLASAAPELLGSLMACARLLADYDESEGEEGEVYRRTVVIIEQATGRRTS